jgi:hypothetical protein
MGGCNASLRGRYSMPVVLVMPAQHRYSFHVVMRPSPKATFGGTEEQENHLSDGFVGLGSRRATRRMLPLRPA